MGVSAGIRKWRQQLHGKFITTSQQCLWTRTDREEGDREREGGGGKEGGRRERGGQWLEYESQVRSQPGLKL